MYCMSKSSYETRWLKVLRELEEDFSDKRISEKEFEVLVGLLLEHEFKMSIQHEINYIMPRPKRKARGIGYINYEWRKHSHAN